MTRVLFILAFSLAWALHTKAQETDTLQLQVDSAQVLVNKKDTAAVINPQDTVHKESRAERRAREKAEKERKKYYYKDILKDSSRLAIEELSRVAWKRSLILPGWGQYTNGGAWWIKVPVIYGGFVSAYLIFDYWQWYYKKFGDEAAFRINNNGAVSDPDFANISSLDYLIRQKDYGRRNRDLTILATVGFWGLNVVEAYTTSILKFRYNIGDDLGFRITPTILTMANQMAFTPSIGRQFTPGIKLTMNIN
jgi:hypothetical protein